VSSPICHSGILFAGGLAWPHSGTAGREGRTYETDRDGDLLLLWCWSCGASKLKESNLESSRRDPPRARSPTIREKTLQPTQAQLSAAPERVRERLAGGGGGGHSSLINLATGSDRAGGGRPIVLRRSEGPHCGSPSLPHFWRVTLFLNQEIHQNASRKL
jgi:hypothetical protein